MRIGILGPFRLVAADGSERDAAPRHQALLALLSIHAGQVVTRDRLVDALWGSRLPDNPDNALQQRVVAARRLLGSVGLRSALTTVADGYRLEVDDDLVDARRFERLADAANDAVRAGDHPAAAGLLEEALALWRGEPLAGIDADWAHTEAQRLGERRIVAEEDRFDVDLALGRHARIVAALEAMVAAHPLRERLVGQLMLALTRSGRQADALAVYDEARQRLATQLGIDPSPLLQRLHLDVLNQQSITAAPAPPPLPMALPLPAPASSFVGRVVECERLRSLLASERLITVTGPGGVGKTRVALEVVTSVASPVSSAASSPVSFVDLTAVVEESDVPDAFARAIGVSPGPGVAALDTVIAALRARPHLLVVDNAEQVVDAVGEVVTRLVGVDPGVRVVVTSRVPLRVDGEMVWPLDPLAVDEPDASGPAPRSDAVTLFLARMAAVVPEVDPDDADVDAVISIVRELDGLPLAIELAAARTRALSVTELAAGLRGELRRGKRRGPQRQRTLHDTLVWSWELLDAAEQRAWMAASVPVAPFDRSLLAVLLEAADAGIGVVDAASMLCEHSLLEVHERGDPTRYRMLRTIRDFGLEQLASQGLETAVRDAHAAAVEQALHVANRTTVTRWDIDIVAQRRWLPDARAARGWLARHGAADRVQRLIAALGWLFYLASDTAEGRRWLDDALGTDPAAVRISEVHPEAVLWAAALRVAADDGRGHAWARLAQQVASDEVTASLARSIEVLFLVLDGALPAARDMIAAEPVRGRWLDGLWRLLDGKLAVIEGRLAEAQTRLDEAQALLVRDHVWVAASTSDALVELAQLRGDVEAVWRAVDRGLQACAALGLRALEAELRCALARVLAASHDHERAEDELHRAAILLEGQGLAIVEAMAVHSRAYAALCRGAYDQASELWQHDLALEDVAGHGLGRSFARWGQGIVAVQRGNLDDAALALRDAWDTAVRRGDPVGAATALEGLASLAVAAGTPRVGATLLGAAAARRAAMGAPAPILTRRWAQETRTRLRAALGVQAEAEAFDAARALGSGALQAVVDRVAGVRTPHPC